MNMLLQSAAEEKNLEHPPDPGITGYQDTVSSLYHGGSCWQLLGRSTEPKALGACRATSSVV